MKKVLFPIVSLVYLLSIVAIAYSGSITWFDGDEYGVGQLCNENDNFPALYADHDECVAAFNSDADVLDCKDAVEKNDYVVIDWGYPAQFVPGEGWVGCPDGGTPTPLFTLLTFCAERLYPETVGECVSALRHAY